LAKLNRIYGPNYDVFFHVRVPKKRIHVNVLVNTTPNIESENSRARGDGNDIQLKIDKGNNMR
jgi:hypothetical protein